ncbi:hypothetical protein SCHPADRAFT_933130 [Schizopora paradoxa]|uniref:Uncharacterized protein n=1 Tax=Schizopora paradoxa TaxID=27342 RepID=A0A0H2R4Q7_9AGAM|nr:hypothetical protein SCHPADRAFT_933130 [Schizopora paradoxa]
MKSKIHSNRTYRGVSEVLTTLEKAAQTTNSHLVDLHEVFRWENWNAFQRIYGGENPFVDDVGSQLFDADLISRFMASTFELDAIAWMLSVLLESANGMRMYFMSTREQIVAKISNGLNSLPGELLANIFRFAVQEEGENGGRQAIWLSHVSRRFRTVALEARALWTTLHSSDSEVQLQTFFCRAGANEKFHAFAHYDLRIKAFGIGWYPNTCLPVISRWKKLTLTQDEPSSIWEIARPNFGGVALLLWKLNDFFSEENYQLPLLEELDIRGHREDIYEYFREHEGEQPAHEWASHLRTLRCSHFLPSPSVNFSSVSQFIFMQDLSEYKQYLRSLLTFLIALPNLCFLELEIQSADEVFPGDGSGPLPLVECHFITSFQLRLRQFSIFRFCEESYITTLMNAIRVPSLEDLSISAGLWDSSLERGKFDPAEWTEYLYDLSAALLPDHLSISSRLTSLSFKLFCDGNPDLPLLLDGRALNISLDRIKKFPTITLSSFIRVLFTRECEDAQEWCADLRKTSRLREIRFIGFKNMAPLDLQWTTWSLGLFRVWKSIERVEVENCKHLVREDVVKIVGEDRLRYSD